MYANLQLSDIMKQVEKYLEEKRKLFYRFYFLSSDELLDLLSSQDEPEIVIGNLKKFYDNIFNLDIDGPFGKGGHIKSLISEEGEKLELRGVGVNTNEPLDKWLNNMQSSMIDTLKNQM